MSCIFSTVLIFCFSTVINFCEAAKFSKSHSENVLLRRLLSDVRKSINKTHNDTKGGKEIFKEGESVAGTEAIVLIIVVIVVLSVIGMVIYFIRKFDQLNRSLPTYRYSSLKTEINGVYGPDDKTESQVLVSVSTEEEEDYDDDEEEDYVAPPTLLVRSQTVMPNKSMNGSLPVCVDKSSVAIDVSSKSVEGSMDSDDELLQ
ncbi:uncharacterized protein LOC129227272 isoform X2 [Uloborus diversus]|uniref:uncharacterized protein LOC129227272 isoform X2 n=1 Tax=Uloborus diversus TaxID=327109 RepID=UPI0024095AE7|nr:uncharacterized protein LOC129227272 isoform X2 [Uloborus diversus]